jgi:hypothetical protein
MHQELNSAEARSRVERTLLRREPYGAACKFVDKIVRFENKK